MGLQNFGMTVGTLLSVGVLYTLTSPMKPELAFPIISVVILLWVVIILLSGMISEPQ
jgi:hypothetical protein